MTGVEQALLIILSGALAIFLILGIIAMSLLIKVLKNLKRLSDKAEAVGGIIEESVRTLTSTRLLSTLLGIFTNHSKRRYRDEKA